MKGLIAIAALLASPALAQDLQPQFTLDYQVGNMVDLNQGFYVCSTDNPRDLMETLMGIKDEKARRARAASGGCKFQLANGQGPLYKITYVQGDACMERYVVEDDHVGRSEAPMPRKHLLCGVEGHQLTVARQGREITVFQLSLDVDFD